MTDAKDIDGLLQEIRSCALCEDRFSQTETAHSPRPVYQWGRGAKILIVGQAPGARVHASGRPFTDPSGDRLRSWMGVDEGVFYNPNKVSILPMAFCFPGYDVRGSDLPPPKLCAHTWRDKLMEMVGPFPLILTIGGYAHRYHLGHKRRVSEVVADWRRFAPNVFPLPHPSWRNTAWLKKNTWFERDVLPALQARVMEVLHG